MEHWTLLSTCIMEIFFLVGIHSVLCNENKKKIKIYLAEICCVHPLYIASMPGGKKAELCLIYVYVA